MKQIKMGTKREIAGWMFVLPWFIGLLVFFIQPVVLFFTFSFFDFEITSGGYVLKPLADGFFSNYIFAWVSDANYPQAFVGAFILTSDLSPFIAISRLDDFSQKDFSAEYGEKTVTNQDSLCWRMLYVENGTSIIVTDGSRYFINRGEIAFFEPNVKYQVESMVGESTRILQISIVVSSDSMLFFKEKIASLNLFEHDNLYSAYKLFLRLSNESVQLSDDKLQVDVSSSVCSRQIIKNHLELVLLSLYQRRIEESRGYRIHSYAKHTREKKIVLQVKAYLQAHISEMLSLETIAEENGYSVSQIQRIFKKETSSSIIDYFIDIKMEFAKQLINEGNKTMSEIADAVGYSNSNYFSRIFRKKVGTTPSNYGNF